MGAAATEVGVLQRELAQTIALVLELTRHYELGSVSAEKERQVCAWAEEAAVSFNGVATDLRRVNGSLSQLIGPANAS